ncbi:MAG: VWA domain-containing protein, partial [Acidobacteriota bacterium]
MKSPRSLVAMLSLVALADLFSGLAVQAQTEPPAFAETVDVQRINVEVWVTDRQGNPVTGLGREAFEVREDGKLVELSNFAEIRRSLPGDPFAPTAPIEAPLEEEVRERPLELEDLLVEDPQADDGGFLALYFDQLFSGLVGREQLVDDLRAFMELRRISPAKVLIVKQDEHLTVEANLGSTRADLDAALERLAKTSPQGVQTAAQERNALRRLQDDWERVAVLGNTAPGQDPCDQFVGEAFREIQLHIDASRGRILRTLEHLDNTAGFLAGLPGPKTLLYMSDGLPTSPGLDLLSFVKHLCPGRALERRLDHQEGLNEAFRRLSRHANANRVTIYSIQALGLRQTSSLTGADQKGVRGT